MARSFLSFPSALAIATLIVLGAGANPGLAQPQPPPSKQPEPESKPTYPEVQQAVQALLGPTHDMPTAVKLLTDAARKYPELPSAHVLLYQILAQVNRPADARFQLEVAINTEPHDPEPYIILGNIALQERRIYEGSRDYDAAREMLKGYTNEKRKGAMEAQTLSGIAQVAELKEDWKEAEARLKDLLRASPDDPSLVARQRLARAQFWQQRAKDAYETLKEAKRLDIANAAKNHTREMFLTPEAIMAQYYDQYEKPKTDDAETWFKSALEHAPNDLPTRQVVAVWALDNGKIAFAKEQAEAALRIEAADANKPRAEQKYAGSNVGHTLRGYVALWEKEWTVAEDNFQNVLFASPNDFVARNNIALALAEQDEPTKKNKALQYANMNYRENDKSPDALSTLGWVYFKRGEWDQAGLALDQAIKAAGGINNPDTATYAAYILHHRERDWEAKQLLEGLVKSNRPFSMRPEAQKLYDAVKDARNPNAPVAPKVP